MNNSNAVIMAGRETLTQKPFYRRLQMAIRAFPYSRRAWLDELEQTLYGFKGDIADQFGHPVYTPNISAVFDDENRWHSHFVKCHADGTPVHLCTRSLHKLQIYQLWLAIKHPIIERHLWR